MKPKFVKIFFITFLIILSIGLVSTQTTLAYELTQSVSSGMVNLAFRDISNTDSTPNPILSLDQHKYRSGDNATLTLTDLVPNVALDGKDFAFAKVDGSSLTLTETDINTGIFTGTFSVGNEFPTIEYVRDFSNPLTTMDPNNGDTGSAFARLSATLDVSNPGEIKISDSRFTDDDFINLCFRPVLHAVDIQLADGATIGSENTKVTLSYANAVLLEDDQVQNLQMYYKKIGISIWEVITPNTAVDSLVNPSDPFSNDFLAKTITSDPAESGYFTQITTGKFTLGFETGCGGGGGGGLVRPSLVLNVLAGVGSFGGGVDGSAPILPLGNLIQYSPLEIPLEIEKMVLNHDSTIPISPMEIGLFEKFDYPMTINDQGFVLGGFSNTLETQTLKTNSTAEIKFILYETTKIQHISFYTNLRDAKTQIHQSDTQILYNDGQPLKTIDPNGFFEDVSVTINEIDENKKEAVFEINFAKEMEKSNIIIRSWDPNLNSLDTHILDAIEVVSNKIEAPTPTYEQPVVIELEPTIPVWIKNNAGWWSNQQIDDSDFVSGIEYLIKNKIINVPGVEVEKNSSSPEIPDWIKNNAGWWAESLITDEDFIEAMQWLIANGVIKI